MLFENISVIHRKARFLLSRLNERSECCSLYCAIIKINTCLLTLNLLHRVSKKIKCNNLQISIESQSHSLTTVFAHSVRPVVLSPLLSARAPTEAEEAVKEEPIKFSTSKASHRTWKVKQSMGSQYEQPWWKVVPIMVFGSAILLWCFLRGETDIDAQLKKDLYERLPGLLSDEEQDSKK